MKFLCMLLAFLVITLSVQPVCASISSTGSCCSENLNTQESEDEDGRKECSSSCNPFQVCGCCAFSAVPTIEPVFNFSKTFSYPAISWAKLNCPIIEEPIIGFWQPPKLS